MFASTALICLIIQHKIFIIQSIPRCQCGQVGLLKNLDKFSYATLPEIYRFKKETTYGRQIIPRLLQAPKNCEFNRKNTTKSQGNGRPLRCFAVAFSLLAKENK